VYRLLTDAGFTPHVRALREDVTARRRGTRARRWVVERTHSWMNRFRALLVRWDKQTANYEGRLHLAGAYISFARAGLLGYAVSVASR
jgi:putative transposase